MQKAAISFVTSNLYNRLDTILLVYPYSRTKWKLQHLKQIHSLLITTNITFLLPKLLHHCISLPSFPPRYVSSLFRQINHPNVDAYNSIIRAFSTTSHAQKSILYFKKSLEERVFPNKHTFPLLLKAFSRSKDQNPFQLYAQICKFGFASDHFVQNSLVSAFASIGHIGSAYQVFDEITCKDNVAYTALIDGYARNGNGMRALELFLEMRSLGVRVDEVAVVSVLCAVGMLRHVWFGRCVQGFYVESGRVRRDVYVDSALVDMYAKCGYCDDSRRVFQEMPYKNLVSWGAMIAGYVQCNRFRDALLLFEDMLVEKVEPNEAILASVLTACAQSGALEIGRRVEEYIQLHKLEMNSVLGTAMIDMYSKCGCIDEALLAFEKTNAKDVYAWSALINALAMHGDAKGSLNVFDKMLSNGIQPSEVTFIGLLSACAHGGFVEEGRQLFERMETVYGLKPNADHYGCMIDLLGRAGRLEEAMEEIEKMPMEPTPGVWGALLGACMIHKAYELGEWIGKHLIKMQQHHSGRYALLANLYSRSQNWDAAASVRRKMKGMGVKKTRGCSWIELSGVVHEFVAFDRSHTDSEEVYTILVCLIAQLESTFLVSEADF